MKIHDLKMLLKEDIYNYRNQIELLKEEKSIIEKILIDLENGRISKSAQKLLYDKYQLSLNSNNLKEVLLIVKNNEFIIDTNLTILTNVLKSTLNVYLALQYHQIISPNLMSFIKNRLLKEKIDDTDIIKTMEFIKIHNTNCHKDRQSSLSSNDLYLIFNMLNSGYEKINIEPINDKKLEGYVKSTINIIESNPISSMDNILHFNNLTLKEQEYIFKRVLKYYQEEIYALISLLQDKEVYFNISILQSIKEEYKILYQKYMFIREKLDNVLFNETDKQNVESISEFISNGQNYDSTQIHLYYSTNSSDPTKCYFIKDLEKMREESYATVLNMINSFKNGNNKNTKYLSTNSNFIELKNDQIRIVLKPIGNGNYSVQGAFIKKSDNDRITYTNIFNRPIAIIDNEYSNNVEQYYEEYLQKSGRKGSR